MNGLFKISVLVVSHFILFHLFGYPQSQPYRFDHLTTKDGLSSNRIFCIMEDSRRIVWIGTDRGLNYYNGNSIVHFTRLKDPPEISKKKISCLFEDMEGMIWIGTMNSGLYVYNPVLDNFRHYSSDTSDSKSLAGNSINAIYQDKRGDIWIGTNGGLNRLNVETETFTSYFPVTQKSYTYRNFITSLMEDRKGIFWVGTGEGIYHFDPRDETFRPFQCKLDIPSEFKKILCFLNTNDGNIWFGTYKGLFKYREDEDMLVHISGSSDGNDHLRDDVIASIRESDLSGKNDLWIATRNGLVKYDMISDCFNRIVITPDKPGGLLNNYINSLWLNEGGILWIGTSFSGVNKLDIQENPFHQVLIRSERDGSLYSYASIFLDKKGCLWVGSNTGGLFKFDQHMNLLAQYHDKRGFTIDYVQDGPVINSVESIMEGSDGLLWVGLAGWGPAVFNKEKEKFVYLDVRPPEGKPRPDRSSDIYEDSFGTIWFATYGLYKKEKTDGRFESFKIVDYRELQQCEIADIYEDSRGDLYFGTYQIGLFCLRSSDRSTMKFSRYGSAASESQGLYNTTVWQTFEDINGSIWVVSGRGLNKYDPGKDQFELVKDTTGLLTGILCNVFGDRKGNLWLSHYPKGLVRYSPDKKTIKVFDTRDGLPFDNIVPRYWYQSSDGRIFLGGWLGDGNGFFYFHPDSIAENKSVPPVIITAFNIGNQPFYPDTNISFKKEITLKYNQDFFSFEFSALDYFNMDKNQYAYFLEGLEDEWIYCGSRRTAFYTGVPPGHYTFHVKGSNNDGYWNETGATISITILPPHWKTWWAYMLYCFVIIGIGSLVIRFYLNRMKLAHKLEMEQRDSQKLKELDGMKSRFFANISHEFRTPLTLIIGPLEKIRSSVSSEVKHDLDIMHRNARRLQQLINQLLSLSKLESGQLKLQTRETDLVRLVNGYVQSFESFAKQKKIDLVFHSESDGIRAYVDQDKLEKILYNLLSNAFKFTGEGGRIVLAVGSQQSAVSSRQSAVGSRQSAVGSRQSTVGSRQSTVGSRQFPVHPLHQFISISVSDTGTGIPPDKLIHIFDRFYQVDDSASRAHEGTGIGLALTKELVELHHGTITVESEPGKGTTFTVTLPLGKEHLKEEEIIGKDETPVDIERYPDDFIANKAIGKRQQAIGSKHLKQVPSSQNQVSGPQYLASKPLILIVEDNTDLRDFIRGYLEETYQLIEAGDGEEGLQQAIVSVPDLIISDVMMPKMDGFQLSVNLKTDERTSHIPVILLTALAAPENKLEGLETGADDFITKPFDPFELRIRIKNLLEQRRKLKDHFIRNAEKVGLSRLIEISGNGISSMDQKFLRKAIAIISERMADPEFNVRTFNAEMAMSRMQVHRKLVAITGQNASSFIRTFRLSRAAQLLAKKSGNVTEIAYEVGFNNLSWFARCFREQFGVLPSEYTADNSDVIQ